MVLEKQAIIPSKYNVKLRHITLNITNFVLLTYVYQRN